MKIGILTLPLHTNYGGILQAYALQTLLEEMGHEVKVINKEQKFRPIPRWRKPLSFVKRTLKKLLVDRRTVIDIEATMRRELPIIHQHTDRFIRQYIHSYMVDSLADIRRDDFDAIVVGSDQIWRPHYFRISWSNDYAESFLSFTDGWDIKRYAYGASFGVDEWEFPIDKTGEYSALVKKFIAVSVREDSGVNLCRRHLGVDAVHVLDPTMLLTKEHYLSLIDSACVPKSSGNLFYYILDMNASKKELIARVARERALQPFTVYADIKNETAPLADRISPPVESWLRAFVDADFIVTDSFHGCAFSIIFGKPFIVIANLGRGLSRMQSLVGMFGLDDHLLLDVDSYDPKLSYNQPMTVKERLMMNRKISLDFLSDIK